MQTYPLETLEALAQGALERSGASTETSHLVAKSLVAAEVDGQAGHGLRRLESYCPQVRSGKVDGNATPKLTATADAAARVDAQSGFAYPALAVAVNWVVDTAPRTGIAACAVHRSHHCGVAGHWVERVAEAGLVGLMFANTPKAIAPAGGTAPLFGTNPIAFATPRAGGTPLVVDLSLSKVARGKIMAAKQQGQSIEPGWALDADGVPTTDPDAALAGSMLPIGDAKGAALALAVEVMAAALTGSQFGHEASSFFEAEGAPPGTGQLLIAFAPTALGGDGALARIEVLCQAVLDQPGTRLPGQNRAEKRAKARAEGLAVDSRVIATIEAL